MPCLGSGPEGEKPRAGTQDVRGQVEQWPVVLGGSAALQQ
jgi:hypothetical protein